MFLFYFSLPLGSLSNLVSLERLALDRNRLGDLDWLESAVCCPNLRHLSASHNEIRTVPDGLAQFRRLETLELGNNKIKQVTDVFEGSKKQSRIGFDGTILEKWLEQMFHNFCLDK